MPPSENRPPSTEASPTPRTSATVPPTVPCSFTWPASSRSPPTSRSHRGFTSPSANTLPRIGLVRLMAMRNGAAEASAGSTRSALALSPWALESWAFSASSSPARCAFRTPFRPMDGSEPRPRTPSSLASRSPVSRAPCPLRVREASTLPVRSSSMTPSPRRCSWAFSSALSPLMRPSKAIWPPSEAASRSLAVRSDPPKRRRAVSVVFRSRRP